MEILGREIRKLQESIDILNERMGKLTSFKHRFYMAIVTGVGTVIGATIIAAILFTILSAVLQSLGGIPYLQDLLDRAADGI